MLQTEKNPATRSDEISLVHLAIIFIRRRIVFYALLVAIISIGLVYAVFGPEKFEYVTLIEVAEEGGDGYLQDPATTVATLDNRWVPGFVSEYAREHNHKLPFDITVMNPENTGLIRIITEGTEDQTDVITQAHHALADAVVNSQKEILSRRKQALENQLAGLDKIMQSLQSSADEGASTALSTAVEKRTETQSILDSLRPAEILVISRQGIESTGLGSGLIVMLAALLGVMVGLFGVFIAEFFSTVRDNLKSQEL